jgi:hypothetical protein
MTATTNGKRTTLADLMAAAKVGAIDPATEVMTAEDADRNAQAAVNRSTVAAAYRATHAAAAADATSTTEHDCAIPGCRHGDAHTGPVQPDRQVKLQCPGCGAVARMTATALARSGGVSCLGDGGVFVATARRVYSRKNAS